MDGKDVLLEVNNLSQYLTSSGRGPGPHLKTIYDKSEFIEWKERVIFILQQMKQLPYITETLRLLQGFNGWSDERNLKELQSRINTIVENYDKFQIQEAIEGAGGNTRLEKGFIVQTAFDDYRLVEQIGQGGNGKVFSARDSAESPVAIKFISSRISEQKRKRFKNEIHFCESHDCQYVIRVIDHGYAKTSDDDYLFYVMPAFAKTLRDKMQEGITPEEILDVFSGILTGLQFAHSKGIIHRDIKPENILLSDSPLRPVICDFGIAHFSEEELYTAVQTKAAERLANFRYAAPEQKQPGAAVGPQADLYAAGLILNEMFTGEIPQAADYKRISDIAPDYAFLDTLFEKLYKQNPSDRIQTANDALLLMKTLASANEHRQNADRISQAIDEINAPEDLQLSISGISFADGVLAFAMNEQIPVEWLAVFVNRDFSRTELDGYEKRRVFQNDSKSLGMRLKGNESENTIRRIVTSVQSWIPSVNKLYNEQRKRDYEAEKKKAEEEQEEELRAQAENNRINEIVSSIQL